MLLQCEAHRASSSRGCIVCTCDDAHHTSSRRASGPLSSASWCLALDQVGVAIVPDSDDSGRTHLKCLPNLRRQFQPCAQWHYAGEHRSDGLSGDVGELCVNATPHQLPLWSTLLSCLRRHSLYQGWQCQWNSLLLLLGPSTCASVGAYRTIASCGLRSSAPAVCVAPAPVLEFSLFVCGERSSWRQLRSRVVISCVLARCLSASVTQQEKFEESSVMEHFLRASAATTVVAAETLRRHTLRLLLRQQGRCGVTLSDCCCGSRDVAASHSHTVVASAGTLPVVVTSHYLLRRSQRRTCDEAPQIRGGCQTSPPFSAEAKWFSLSCGGARIRLCFSGVATCDV